MSDETTGFHGIYPMQYALFGADGRLDREAMARQVDASLASGAHGVAILGIATEVSKLSAQERSRVLEWSAGRIAGRVPLAVTVFGRTVDEQSDFVAEASAAGAAWVILQPPVDRGFDGDELLRFFGAIADRSDLPVAIQNAPQYLGIGLDAARIETLRRNHPNFTLLKGEASAVDIRQVIETTGGGLTVFNGRGGLELIDILRAGCRGMIPAPDTVDRQVRIYDLLRSGRDDDAAAAEALYREMLPAVTFIMQSIDTLICYGKRVAAMRLGLEGTTDRPPAMAPSDFGLDCARRYARALGPLPGV